MYSIIGTILVVIVILVINVRISRPKRFGTNEVYAVLLLSATLFNFLIGVGSVVYGITVNNPIVFGGIMLIILSVYQLSIFHREY